MSKVEASVDRIRLVKLIADALDQPMVQVRASDLTVILEELDRLSEQERAVRGALLIDCSGGEK